MKILAFSDLHGNKSAIKRLKKKAEGVDVIVGAGDVTWFGDKLNEILGELNKLGKLVLLIHGNHELLEDMEKGVKKLKNIKVMHCKMISLGDRLKGKVAFFGYGGGGFSETDRRLESMISKIKKKLERGDKMVFMSHAPPKKTKCDLIPGYGHVGSKSIRKFIEILKPVYNVNGHLHETFSRRDRIGDTIVINPGPEGKILRV